jgi:subtilase family serine protease
MFASIQSSMARSRLVLAATLALGAIAPAGLSSAAEQLVKAPALKPGTTINTTDMLGLHPLKGHVLEVIKTAPKIGPMNPANTMQLVIAVPVRNEKELRQFLKDVHDRKSPHYHHYLTPQQYAEQYSPTQKDYEAAIAYVRSKGLTVGKTYGSRMVFEASGTVDAIQKAFSTEISEFKRADGSTFHAVVKEPALQLTVPIIHISGLNNYVRPTPTSIFRRLNGITAIHPGEITPHTTVRTQRVPTGKETGGTAHANDLVGSGPGGLLGGPDFRNAYATGTKYQGEGQSVALFELDGFYAADIASYKAKFGIGNIPVQTVLNDGFNGSPGTNDSEVALDIEMCLAMCPKLNSVVVVEGTQANSILAAIASPPSGVPLCLQVSASWNFGIDDTSQSLVNEMAAQGQSVFFSAGDNGSYNGQSDDRNMDNVTIVGGTVLTLAAKTLAYSSETTWSGGGGGTVNAGLPDYQDPLNMTSNLGSRSNRNVPDVSAVAQNVFTFADNGVTYTTSGTSVSAPIWAGWTALANEQALKAGTGVIGFMNTAIYPLAQVPQLYAADFHDINDGSTNTSNNDPNHYKAVNGFDLATGLGSPRVGLIDQLAPLPPANVTPVSYDWVEFVIGTGGDDLRGDSSATVTLQAPGSHATVASFTLKGKNQGSWDNNTTHDLTFALPHPVTEGQISDVVVTLVQGGSFPETDDNWNIQNMKVILIAADHTQKQKVNVSGNPAIRLTGSRGSQTFAFTQ